MTPAPRLQRVVNDALLDELELQIGSESMNRALAFLLADLRDCTDSLAACLDSGDEARARRTGHKLKGIIDQYGLYDAEGCARNLSSRYDLYWLTDATSLSRFCELAIEELRARQQTRATPERHHAFDCRKRAG